MYLQVSGNYAWSEETDYKKDGNAAIVSTDSDKVQIHNAELSAANGGTFHSK